MKTVEKEFTNDLEKIVNSTELSESNRYFINKVVEILKNESSYDINLINLNNFSELLDSFNYEGYNRGLFIMKMVINNLRIINSKPYSKIDIFKYKDIYLKRNINYQQFIIDVRKAINNAGQTHELNEYQYEIFKMLQQEEKNRLIKIKRAKIVQKAYDNLDIDKLLSYFKSINLTDKDIEGLKIYLNSLKEKKENKSNEMTSTFDYRINPVKLGYTNKEIKIMDEELTNILKEIDEKHLKITYEQYLKYVNYVFILEPENKACDADIDRLYDALEIDSKMYSFLISKGNSLLQTNKAIDIKNVLQDIDDIENIILTCSDKDKEEFKILLANMYKSLYYLEAYNHNYERKYIKQLQKI